MPYLIAYVENINVFIHAEYNSNFFFSFSFYFYFCNISIITILSSPAFECTILHAFTSNIDIRYSWRDINI